MYLKNRVCKKIGGCNKNRIIALLLCAVMALSAAGAAAGAAEVYAADETAVNEQSGNDYETADEGENAAAPEGAGADSSSDAAADAVSQGTSDTAAMTDAEGSEGEDGMLNAAASDTKASEAAAIADITAEEDAKGSLTISWAEVEGAKLYKVGSVLPKKAKLSWKGSAAECSFDGLSRSTKYSFTVSAYSDSKAADLIAQGTISYTTRAIVFDESGFRTVKSKKISVTRLPGSLREMIGEGNGGYAVAQGSATDGTYAYHMMASSSTQKGRVLKVRIKDNKVIKKGPVINIHHGNGMTYDSKRKQLVVVGYGSWRHQLSFIDTKTLKLVKQTNVSYPYTKMEGVKNGYHKNGNAAIAYVPKYDVYLTRERGDKVHGGVNDIMVFNADDLKMVGYIRTRVTSKYPETYQSMDADDKYVYFVLSAGSGQPYNIILALDWNSENLLPVVNGEKKYITNMWYCNNDGSGEPDGVLRIKTSHEIEGLYHTTDSKTGKEHFYLTEYYGRWGYKTVKKKTAYKVKWKKVTKKVKVNGKWKKKKVWKYKTKYKTVKVRVRDTWKRDDYVYDLGII